MDSAARKFGNALRRSSLADKVERKNVRTQAELLADVTREAGA